MTEYFIGITDKGKRREKNEDTFIAQEVSGKEYLIACVIDGVGGYKGGDIAAGTAKAVLLEHLQKLNGDIITTLQQAIVAANARIYHERKAGEQHEHMACVLTCAVTDIKNNKFYYAHVGDTRLYLLRDHSLVKISKDHSVVGFLEESGRLSEEDAMNHPRRNEINKALGFEEPIINVQEYIETGESPFLPGDIILLCSDGLSDMISSNTILNILEKNNSLTQKAQQLIDAANNAGGNDNITAVLVENNKQPKTLEAVKPLERKNTASKPSLSIIKDAAQQTGGVNRKTNRLTVFLVLLSAALSIALCITLFQNSPKEHLVQKVSIAKPKDEKAIQLLSFTKDTSKVFALAGNELFLSDAILINKDSFHLYGNGTTIVSDSGYAGPAFIISTTAKQIILDSIVLKNFKVGVIVQKNNVVLKNVRFINCLVPIEYRMLFPDSIVSGRIKDSVFIINPNRNK